MTDKRQFDFWYAVNQTRILQLPRQQLETFGNTLVHYHLLTEPMDSVGQVCIREGRIEAYRPRILTPHSAAESFIEGFGPEAERYADWLRAHDDDLWLIQYGFLIRKQEINRHFVSEPLPTVIEQVRERLATAAEPMSALVLGVDEPWEVCLLKLMVEVIRQAAPRHARELRRDPQGRRREVEALFDAAAADRSRLNELGTTLQKYKLFEEYEDRFFDLMKGKST